MDGITVETKVQSAAPSHSFSKDETTSLAGYLGLSSVSEQDKASLQRIVDFYKEETKELTDADLLFKVRQLESRLGSPSLGERRVDKLYAYVKTQGQITRLEKERDSLLR